MNFVVTFLFVIGAFSLLTALGVLLAEECFLIAINLVIGVGCIIVAVCMLGGLM